MSAKLISVIMPVYNVEEYVGEAISSVLQQSHKNIELMVVEDCSSDKSREVVNSFTDPRLRVINLEKNSGVAFARNLAIRESKGDYLALLDSDDVMSKDRLERQLTFMQRQPEIGLCGGWIRTISPDNKISYFPKKTHIESNAISPALVFGNFFCTSSIMMRREVVPTDGFRQRYAEDYDFLVRVAEKHRLAIAKEVYAHYRIRPGSATYTYAMDTKRQDVWESQAPIFEALKLVPTPEEQETHLFSRTYRGNLDSEQLLRIYLWYMKLVEANQKAGLYPDQDFKMAASFMWFPQLYRATGCGADALRMHFGRSLSFEHPQPMALRTKFVIKAAMGKSFSN